MRLFISILFLFIVFMEQNILFAADLTGDNYTITSTVVSGGGTPAQTSGISYSINGTIGQSTPLPQFGNPISGGLNPTEMKPGFWNTVCPQDRDGDNIVDGIDLAKVADSNDPTLAVVAFAGSFGRSCL